jgi:hypothetical protein
VRHFFRRLGRWTAARLSEPSTFAGFSLLAAAGGRHIPQEIMDAVTWWVPFLSGALIALKEDDTPR